jgi:hypothetical protein
MKTLDPYTFGKDKVSVTLAKILNELDEPNVVRRVSNIILLVHRRIEPLEKIENKGTKRFLYTLLRKYFYDKIDNSLVIKDKEIISFTKNYVTTKLRVIFLE